MNQREYKLHVTKLLTKEKKEKEKGREKGEGKKRREKKKEERGKKSDKYLRRSDKRGDGREAEQNNSVLQTGNVVSSSSNWTNEPASCLILRGAIGYLEFHRRHEPIDFPIARQFHFSFLFFLFFSCLANSTSVLSRK